MDAVKTLTEMLKSSSSTVFFGGAGVSTESGIPDFRSSKGIYTEKGHRIPPEEIISIGFLESQPEHFFDFYRKRLVYMDAKPNMAHLKLAELESAGKLAAVITQNIDGLHQAAGSENVIEMHGSIRQGFCMACGMKYGTEALLNSTGVPRCECGGIIRPKVTLYGEELDHNAISAAVNRIAAADMLIVAGTSLQVYPVAGFLGYFRGRYIVIINKTETNLDYRADLIIRDPVGETLGRIELKDLM
ncbi:MAG: NAD-dependent protein deacylase [Defluviitaleaceae bacterium]|nr:NAD-dependent protein deacylase [Defluviitaleaceae bacterium]MCL2835638.1 NAD-dependent protein deacylase [Defluviitaleaceae bacterium]